jgi:hypothetical protein
VRATSRYRVLLYAFDPATRETTTVAAPAAPDDSSMGPLQSVARQTGGEAVLAGGDLVPALRRVSRDLDTYYVLSYTSTNAGDGRFYDVQVTSTRRDAQVRTRSGYWSPLAADSLTRRANDTPALPLRGLKRSPLIDYWLGYTVGPDKQRRAIFTWSPSTLPVRAKVLGRPDVVQLKVSSPNGKSLFEGEVAAVHGSTVSSARVDLAVFDVPAGRIQLDMVILQADGTRIDFAAQDQDTPPLKGVGPVILPPQLFRTSSAREFRETSVDPAAAPVPTREFRRTERLLIRVPAYAAGEVKVAVTLKNRVGQSLRELVPMAAPAEGDPPAVAAVTLPQFDLPLSWIAPGDYSLEIAATSEGGTVRELIRFRVTG